MDDGTAPAPKPDMMEQMKVLLNRYGDNEDLVRKDATYTRDATMLLASAILAVAGELRDIHNVLAGLGETTGAARTMPSTVNMCVWAVNPNGWYGACGYEAPDDIDDIIAGQDSNKPRCPGCGGTIFTLRPERVA